MSNEGRNARAHTCVRRSRTSARAHDPTTPSTLNRAPVGQGPPGPGWLAISFGFWSGRALATGTAWAGLCCRYMFNSPSSRPNHPRKDRQCRSKMANNLNNFTLLPLLRQSGTQKQTNKQASKTRQTRARAHPTEVWTRPRRAAARRVATGSRSARARRRSGRRCRTRRACCPC